MRVTSFDEIAEERQVEFRKMSPTISPEGRAPRDENGKRYNYMLAHGREDENLYPPLRGEDGARKFFSDRNIQWWFHNGFDRGSRNKPTRNMKSSQPMCVNFLLPLVETDGALEAIVRTIDCDVEHIVDVFHEGNVSRVEFEWIGVPVSLEGRRGPRGAMNTSVDVFIIVETSAGQRRAYLIEWKYRETADTENYGAGSRGETRRGIYSEMYSAKSSAFTGEVPMDDLLYGEFYQLMRLRLLGDRMVRNRELGVSDAKVVLVVPDANTDFRNSITSPPLAERFPHLGSVVNVFRATLEEPKKAFATVSPSTLLEAVERECGETPAISEWAAYMRKRYGL